MPFRVGCLLINVEGAWGVTSIAKDFIQCDLRSGEVIEALQASNQAVIDQVASRIYANLLSVTTEMQDAPDWSQKDEKLKWTLHSIVEVFGGVLKTEELLTQVEGGNYKDPGLMTELANELKFLLLDLLGLYYELDYSTWNLITLLTPEDLKEEQVTAFVKPALQLSPPAANESETSFEVLNQALTNWRHSSEAYKSLLLRAYEANEHDTIVAFHSLLSVAAQLISVSHLAWLLLLFRARSSVRKF